MHREGNSNNCIYAVERSEAQFTLRRAETISADDPMSRKARSVFSYYFPSALHLAVYKRLPSIFNDPTNPNIWL